MALRPEKPNDGVGVDRLARGLSLSLSFGLLDQRFPKTGPLKRAVFDERISRAVEQFGRVVKDYGVTLGYSPHDQRVWGKPKRRAMEPLVCDARMVERVQPWVLVGLLAWALLLPAAVLSQSPVPVLHTEGLVHGFLVLRTLEGKALADGEVTQVARGDRVTSHLVFRFKDGSVHEETVVFSQRNRFRVVSDHLLQKGPAFKRPMDISIEGLTGQITVRYTDDDGKEKTVNERLKLPQDIANGMILMLLKNIRPNVPQTTVSMVAATPKPRLVKLLISPEGEDSFSVGGSSHKATRYVVKVEIGGVAGAVAPLVGKEPQDTHVWILGGDAPAFVKSEGPLYEGGPTWQIELTSPVWQDH